jgi:photosystem II stability/assembly factor-like uncharacterized protein
MDGVFLTASEGWVVGLPNLVYYTSDGGNAWRRLGAGSAPNGLFRSVAFVSSTVGWIGDLNQFTNPLPSRALWETRDGGNTWINITNRVVGPEPVGICGMWRVDASTVYGVGRWQSPAVFVRTRDAGATWQSVSLAPLLTGAVDVYFFDRDRGIVVGGRGVGPTVAEQESSRTVIVMTADGGDTWVERHVSTAVGSWAWKISFPTPDVGYVAIQGPNPAGLILKTTDGGITWAEITVPVSSGFEGIGFVTALHGWVSGSNGVLETTDGGVTWQPATWGAGESVNRFRMNGAAPGYAMGKVVYRYEPEN